MAETKNPRYTIKHVDGVMHLMLNPEGSVLTEIPNLRTLPPVVEGREKKQ